MNKCDTIAYYEALGDSGSLICIDSQDSISDITEKIKQQTQNHSFNTFDIEIFHNDNGVKSYKLMAFTDETVFDLWSDMTKQISKKSISVIAEYILSNLPKTAKSPYEKYIAEKTNDVFVVKSFVDKDFEMTLDPKTVTSEILEDHILGQYRHSDGNIEWHPINADVDISDFEPYINLIASDEIRLFAKTCMMLIPDYVFEVPASNDSVTRQASDLADGGLKRHILNSLNMLVKLTELDYARIKFTQHEIDMMIVACLFHDFLKSGWQEDYEMCSATKFDHPRIEARALRCVTDIVPANDLLFITNCIESHNGQFNTDPEDHNCVPLPTPDTECKYTVHLAVHLAKHKDLLFTNHDELYIYKNSNVKTINEYLPISDADIITLQNALHNAVIDKATAKELGIHRNDADIRKIWTEMIDTRRTTDRNVKYIKLANEIMFD